MPCCYISNVKSSLCCETQKKRNAHQHVRPTEYAAKTTTRSACGTLPPPLSLFPQAAQPFLHPLVPLKSTFLPPPRCNPRNISVLLPVPGLPMDRRKRFMFYPKIPHHHTATSLDMFLHCTQHHRTKHALVGRLEVRVAILSSNKRTALWKSEHNPTRLRKLSAAWLGYQRLLTAHCLVVITCLLYTSPSPRD